ncbi:MBL fold metallo-hydrolase [Mycobacterium sp. WMMD1722]
MHADDVDLVINTHIHYDHVGWNTRRGSLTARARRNALRPRL